MRMIVKCTLGGSEELRIPEETRNNDEMIESIYGWLFKYSRAHIYLLKYCEQFFNCLVTTMIWTMICYNDDRIATNRGSAIC